MFRRILLTARDTFGSSGSSFPGFYAGFSSANFESSDLNHGLPADFVFSASKNGSDSIYQAQAGDNSTSDFDRSEFIQTITFAAAKSIRTSTVILAVFNTIAAFATFAWIIFESRRSHRQAACAQRMRKDLLSFVSSPDLFPLIVSGSITFQGIIFAVAQSRGLDGFVGGGCSLIAQFMLPGLLLVPTTQFVLGCELFFRAIRAQPFQERGRWTVPISLTIIGLVTLISFLVADFMRVGDKCFMSLFWFISDYAVGIFLVLVTYSASLLGIVIYIFIKLTKISNIEASERVNASRMIYYLSLAVLSNAFICPFFFVVGFLKTEWGEGPASALNLSMIAGVVASVTGLMTGGLHLFLRSSSISTIGPRDKLEEQERAMLKNKIRLGAFNSSFDGNSPAGLGYGDTITYNYSNSTSYIKPVELPVPSEHSETLPLSSVHTNTIAYSQEATPVQVPPPVQNGKGHFRKTSSYSLFPGKEKNTSMASMLLLPSTTYNPNAAASSRNSSRNSTLRLPARDHLGLRPPPSVLSNYTNHRRDSSMGSLATVQIGLRLSNVNDIPAIDPKALEDKTIHYLECPYAAQSRQKHQEPSERSNLHVPSFCNSDEETVYERESTVPNDLPRRDAIKDARMKTLPPVPTPTTKYKEEQPEKQPEEEQITLSPTVYIPHSPSKANKLPSPRGVGFTSPPKR